MGLSNFLIKGRMFEPTIPTTLEENPCSVEQEVSIQMMDV